MLDEKRTFRSPKKVNHSFLYSEQCNELIFVPSTLIRKKKKNSQVFLQAMADCFCPQNQML